MRLNLLRLLTGGFFVSINSQELLPDLSDFEDLDLLSLGEALKDFPENSPCDQGYSLDEEDNCIDVDECSILDLCGSQQTCKNIPGSYECLCPQGYIDSHGEGVCTDIDECHENQLRSLFFEEEPKSLCKTAANCVNTPGSYYCKCEGQHDSVSDCDDVDECETGEHNCAENQKCTNTIGSFFCDCKPGYRMDFDGNCHDVDECENENICNGDEFSKFSNFTEIDNLEVENFPQRHSQKCVNSEGSFECVCKNGFKKSGKFCVDDNECDREDICGEHASCHNWYGGYTCACHRGYTKIDGKYKNYSTRHQN